MRLSYYDPKYTRDFFQKKIYHYVEFFRETQYQRAGMFFESPAYKLQWGEINSSVSNLNRSFDLDLDITEVEKDGLVPIYRLAEIAYRESYKTDLNPSDFGPITSIPDVSFVIGRFSTSRITSWSLWKRISASNPKYPNLQIKWGGGGNEEMFARIVDHTFGCSLTFDFMANRHAEFIPALKDRRAVFHDGMITFKDEFRSLVFPSAKSADETLREEMLRTADTNGLVIL